MWKNFRPFHHEAFLFNIFQIVKFVYYLLSMIINTLNAMGVTGDWLTKIGTNKYIIWRNVNSYKFLLPATKGINSKVRNGKSCNSSLGLLRVQINMNELWFMKGPGT